MIPETKVSLILRLGQTDDHDAWSQFANAYQSVIFWSAKRQGLQPADADDIVQQVMTSIAKALRERPHDHSRAKFRTWLYRVTQNAILNCLERQKPDRGSGKESTFDLLANVAATPDDMDQFDREYERAVFHWAANLIKPEFQATTWQAFWLTMVEGQSCAAAAKTISEITGESLGIGSVYAARSRVVKRLRKKVEEFDDSCQI
ncbi:MAG: sigma-70 family RNA polymerase sigma factor [Planctomycetota bacterium]